MNPDTSSGQNFSYSFAELQQVANDILNHAKRGGATACEANVSDGFGLNVTVRQNAVEVS